VRHVLVTNDFPPKVGGIQTYLWELWRRLPAPDVTVLTTRGPGDAAFDAIQPFRIERSEARVLLPTAALARRVERLAAACGAEVVVVDPVLPVGLVGRRLSIPYAVVLHGAEVAVPARLPGTARLLASVLRRADHVIAGGAYPVAEARRVVGSAMPATTIVPPGVDVERFRPLSPEERLEARASFGLPTHGPLVVSASRLVPRKGLDVLIEAAARLAPAHPGLRVLVAGAGRDRRRLERLITRSTAPVRLLGQLPAERLPVLYGCADLFAMPCRTRWGGLEQEGFGMVFAEAAACGVPQVAGDSGGASEAVVDGETGVVVSRPRDPVQVAAALDRLLGDEVARRAMGRAARRRAESELSYDVLAARFGEALAGMRAR
jgi:phosphatidylinositol alpha-1,6-mannosyltransferase